MSVSCAEVTLFVTFRQFKLYSIAFPFLLWPLGNPEPGSKLTQSKHIDACLLKSHFLISRLLLQSYFMLAIFAASNPFFFFKLKDVGIYTPNEYS
jgi:hypothetical protein